MSSKFDIWPSVSDMMSALMLIFLFIAVLFMVRVEVKQKELVELADSFQVQQDQLVTDVIEAFEDDVEEWGGEILPNGNIRFNDPELIFERGSSVIRPKFKGILTDFFPRYIQTVKEHKNEVSEILIEGHTSSEWRGAARIEDIYLNNINLSSARALSILSFCFSLIENEEDKVWMTQVLRSTGVAFGEPIIIDGVEDLELSKRVEFSINSDSDNRLQTLIEKAQSSSTQRTISNIVGGSN